MAAGGPVARRPRLPGHHADSPWLSYDVSPAGLRLADAIDYLVSEVERRDLTDVIIAGHSWGGYPATGAAHRLASRVTKVIYHSAVVPEQGKSMADENWQYGEIIRQAVAASPDSTVSIGLDAVQGGLMAGDPTPVQELVSRMLVPQPGRYMLDSLDLPPVTKIGLDAAYVLCADDVALGPARSRVRRTARRRSGGRAGQSPDAAEPARDRGRRADLRALRPCACPTFQVTSCSRSNRRAESLRPGRQVGSSPPATVREVVILTVGVA
ncbi:MAG TPA: alpha/beta fold hydrolase [Pseudonocardiaceae bacterium]|nr:alpha/beta fold hydrolase [Pseudonocardiaceae bacterium]